MSITKILQGIDRYESAYTDGWWETSSGAEFGRLKLVEAQGYEYGLLGRITELEAQLEAVQKDAAWIPVGERLPEIPTNCSREFIVAC
jgi:hypothetical protein